MAAPRGLELDVERFGEAFEISVNLKEKPHERGEGIIVDLGVVEYIDKGQRKKDAHSREFGGEPEVRHGVQLLVL